MQFQLFIDTKLKGNVFIRQLCSKGKKTNNTTSKQTKNRRHEQEEKREKTLKGTSQRAGKRYRSR